MYSLHLANEVNEEVNEEVVFCVSRLMTTCWTDLFIYLIT